jgi:hypothetical protein|tara:strand:+ start:185 stop:829 length:645 start_codon:yes stop_codon:yes gene_type:complete
MKKIDDIKLQMYVDGELDSNETKEVKSYLEINSEAKILVDNYKKINHLISSTYNQIKSDDMPKKTLDLLMDEKPSFLSHLLNYKIKLIPAMSSAAVIAFVVMLGFNTQTVVNNTTNPMELMSEKNKHAVLNQLENILKNSEENLSGIVSFSNKNIQYEEIKSYIDERGRESKDIKFKNFIIKDANINEATFVKTKSGDWKVTKLEFIKGNFQGI